MGGTLVMDTVRIRRDPDYFPLIVGLRWNYQHTSTEFDGIESVEIEIQDVQGFREDVLAAALIRRRRMGQETSKSYRIKKTAKEVSSDSGVLGWGRKEFPLPPVPGKTWIEEPDRHEIASLDSEIQVPAGHYIRCLRVNTLLAGGDGGSALRYYAPGVGYVYEEYSSETSGSRVSLSSFHLPGQKQ